ncbi:MAG TPA: hypothetical protein VI703_05700 [Anaerolineales bacterium]|jgi:hypothetical protein|nr:hypothetical protein [Anaerolineales bacterium]
MPDHPSPNDLVLVAFLPSPKDLEIARVLGWYRIPLRTAPRVVAVDTLAFYQPATFGDGHKWCIEFVAPVLGHELTTRGQLFKEDSDHPRSGEEYFKLQLGALQALSRPIPATDWKRITFLYTTGERVLNAQTIDDLSVHDEERQVLWRALRERAEKEQQYGADHLPELPWDPELLAFFGLRGSGPLYSGDDAE